jgi:hypothetical protein
LQPWKPGSVPTGGGENFVSWAVIVGNPRNVTFDQAQVQVVLYADDGTVVKSMEKAVNLIPPGGQGVAAK